MKNNQILRYAVMCSGNGSNLQALIDSSNTGTITASINAIIASKPESGAIKIAKSNNIKNYVLDVRSTELRDISLIKIINELKPDFIVLSGYTKKIPLKLIALYPDKIINIHPSLLPEFGGKGMYGIHVHKAVIESGKSKSGFTVHLVSKEYDKGRKLKQYEVEVLKDDTPESLSLKILELENIYYPIVIQEFIESDLLK